MAHQRIPIAHKSESSLALSGLVLLIVTLAVGPATAATIVNGSFESPGGACAELPAGSDVLFGWTVLPTGITYLPVGGCGLWPSPDGLAHVMLSAGGFGGPGGIAQTFETVPGQAYEVTFLLSGHPWIAGGSPVIKTLNVSATGSEVQTYTFDSTGNNYNEPFTPFVWSQETYHFTATAANTTLAFESATPFDAGPLLDNISIADAAVPEPAPSVLVGAGILAVLGIARQRRRWKCSLTGSWQSQST